MEEIMFGFFKMTAKGIFISLLVVILGETNLLKLGINFPILRDLCFVSSIFFGSYMLSNPIDNMPVWLIAALAGMVIASLIMLAVTSFYSLSI